jgi:hypothetical protein
MFAPEKDGVGYLEYYTIINLLIYPRKSWWAFTFDGGGKAYVQNFGGEISWEMAT